jgi:adenine-specific DNA-methyltransferase
MKDRAPGGSRQKQPGGAHPPSGARPPRSPPRSPAPEGRGPRRDGAKKAPYGKRPLPKDAPGIRNPYLRYRPLKKPEVALHPSTLWDYPSQHYGKTDQGSQHYRGATPSHIIWNVIARHSKEEDLVVDPFCGSGTTLDVAKDLNRRSRGFDVAPSRPDIEKGDAQRLKMLLGRDTPHVIFFDPPYADNLTYSDDPACIGKLAYGPWQKAMNNVVIECHKSLKQGGVLAMFVCDIIHHTQKPNGRGNLEKAVEFWPLGHDLTAMALRAGFTMIDHVAVVRRGKALDDPRLRARAEQEGFMLRGFSHLMLFRR